METKEKPPKEYRISKYLTEKFEKEKLIIYVNKKEFIRCVGLLFVTLQDNLN